MAFHLNPSQFTQRGALGAAPASYLPSDNPTSLIAWFRKGVGITESAGLASAWADQSGNGNNLVQATGTNQPAYSAGVLTFDGVDNFMKCVTFTLAQPTQVSILAQQVTWTANEKLYDGNGNSSGALTQRTASPGIAIIAGLGLVALNNDMTVGAYHAVTVLFSGASSTILVGGGTATTGDPGSSSMSGFTLGANGTPGQYGNVDVKEVIIRNVDDATIRANDHAYLQTL